MKKFAPDWRRDESDGGRGRHGYECLCHQNKDKTICPPEGGRYRFNTNCNCNRNRDCANYQPRM